MRWRLRARCIACVSNSLQFVTETWPVDCANIKSFLYRKTSNEHQRTKHVRSKTSSFFVGKHSNSEWPLRFNSCLLKSFNHLQSSENSEVAVIFSACPNGINVGSRHYWCALSYIPRANNVSNHVDRNLHPQILHPCNDEIASVFVFICQSETTVSATLNRGNGCQSHDSIHEALTIYTKR